MPRVWVRTAVVTQEKWKRLGRAFCDGCGMVIKDDYYWKWSVSHSGNPIEAIYDERNSHNATYCIGLVIRDLLNAGGRGPFEEQTVCSSPGEADRTEQRPLI